MQNRVLAVAVDADGNLTADTDKVNRALTLTKPVFLTQSS